MAAALPFVLPVLPLAVPRIGRGFSRIAKKYAPGKVLPVKPVTNTEPFKGKFPERDFSGASLMQVRPIDVSSLAVTDARVPIPITRARFYRWIQHVQIGLQIGG